MVAMMIIAMTAAARSIYSTAKAIGQGQQRQSKRVPPKANAPRFYIIAQSRVKESAGPL